MTARAILIAIAVMIPAQPLAAQRLPPPLPLVVSPAPQQRVAPPDDPSGATLGALVGGMAGMVAGTALAYGVSGSSRSDEDFGPFIGGAYIGLPVGAALGAWMGNARRGSFDWDLAITGAVAVGGFVATRQTNDARVFLGSLLAQVITAAIVERVTGADQAPRDSLTTGQAR